MLRGLVTCGAVLLFWVCRSASCYAPSSRGLGVQGLIGEPVQGMGLGPVTAGWAVTTTSCGNDASNPKGAESENPRWRLLGGRGVEETLAAIFVPEC